MDQKRSVINQLIGYAVRRAAFISGLALLWLMALTIGAVVMRYLFNAPILGAQDLSEVSLVLVVFPAMAYCGWTGGHVALDLISSFFSSAKLRWSDSLIQLISGILFIYLSWVSAWRGLDALEYGDASNLIEIPHWPFFFVISLGSALYAVVLMTLAVKAARRPARISD